jgi:hypothetical protein
MKVLNSTQRKTLMVIAAGLTTVLGPLKAIEPQDILVFSKEPFLLKPRLALNETYNDNVFSRPNAKEDFYTTISPGLNVRLGKEIGNFISLDYNFSQRFHVNLPELNAGEHSFAIRNRLQGNRLVLTGSDSISLLSNPIGVSEEVNLVRPRETTPPVTVPGGDEGGVPIPTPPPTVDPGSPIRGGEVLTIFEERNVDYNSHSHSYNLGYAISEKTGTYVQGQYSSTDYEEGVGLYDLNTWRATGGFAFHALPKTSFFGEVYYGQTETTPNFTAPSVPNVRFIGGSLGARGSFTEKLTGQVRVGYETREFEDNADAPSSPVADMSLNYRLSAKSSLSLSYARSHDVSVQYAKESYTANTVSGQFNQVLGSSGKWRASVGGSWGMIEYESTVGSATREYDQYSAYFGLEYRLQLWLSMRLGYSFSALRYGADRLSDYDVNRVNLGLAIGY